MSDSAHRIKEEKSMEAVVKDLPVVPERDLTPRGLLSIAVQQGADLDKLERLMLLQERWEENEARKAFNVAFAAFKDEAVTVIKNRQVTDGPLKGKSYAELFSVVNAVTPALSKHGLSTSWRLTKDEKDWIEVTCTLKHILGHSDCVSMGGPPDTGGAKSAIQARASTISYLERYTLKAVCGVAEQGDDNDGASGSRMDENVLVDHLSAIDAASNEESLRACFGTAWKAAQAVKDKYAMKKFTEHKDARKKALGGKP
jgi:hypothetical protein